MTKTQKKTKHPLHELLAVLADLDGAAKSIREETIATFIKKTNHFNGHIKTLSMYDESRKIEEEGARETRVLVTTVDEKLAYTTKSQTKHYNALLQQEATNQVASADLIINGEVFAENLPATFLLGMESRLRALRDVFISIPTLDPSISWTPDSDTGEGVFKSVAPETSYKQEKTVQHKVIVQPTKEHPAQVREWSDNRNVGTFNITRISSCISPAKKSQYLEKLDTLIQAFKKARQRANTTEIQKRTIGKQLFEFILGD